MKGTQVKTLTSLVVIAALTASACGSSSPTTPSAPTVVTPTVAQVAGVWTKTTTLTGLNGGDCLGATYQLLVGFSFQSTLAVTQSGSVLAATSTNQSTGTTCAFTGSAGASTIVLNVTSCQAGFASGVRCTNGAVRDTQLVALGLTGSLNGNIVTGTQAESYNVFISGTPSGVGVLILTSAISMSR